MDALITDNLIKVLMISVTFSIIEMALVQKVKDIKIFKKSYQVAIFNVLSSFIIGTLFSISFFDLNIYDSLWVSLFSFIGASSIYEMLKKQNMINFTPKSVSDTVTIKKDNEIKRT